MRKGGHFPSILDPSSSARAFLLCNAVFSLGLKFAALCSLNPNEVV